MSFRVLREDLLGISPLGTSCRGGGASMRPLLRAKQVARQEISTPMKSGHPVFPSYECRGCEGTAGELHFASGESARRVMAGTRIPGGGVMDSCVLVEKADGVGILTPEPPGSAQRHEPPAQHGAARRRHAAD